jgi:signal transduction histidine kinase
MDIYERKSKWKWYLVGLGFIIVLISLFYTRYVTQKLAKEEEKRAQQIIKAFEEVSKPLNLDCEQCLDFTFQNEILQSNTTIPAILVSETGEINFALNFGEDKDSDQEFLKKELESMIQEGIQPIQGESQKIYFRNSNLLRLLQLFPLFQLFLIGSFIVFGYFAFSSARRAEQNQVWVGMAKETAHQLGTPITAIMGWIDHLKEMYGNDEYMIDVVGELKKDAGRLELIADRFSKIGSEPKLKSVNIYEELDRIKTYMARRASRRIEFEFPEVGNNIEQVNINPPLFNWVLENLLRNALDAMGGKGKISAAVFKEKNHIRIEVSDTGKGIPSSKFKTVFKPGYSTKKRGWGLGLSLAKRIIETYHSGKIFVSKSIPNEQTTFTIKLPVNHYVGGEPEI